MDNSKGIEHSRMILDTSDLSGTVHYDPPRRPRHLLRLRFQRTGAEYPLMISSTRIDLSLCGVPHHIIAAADN
jgi:hypothetical protein